jgi:hypothetical protein
MHNAGSPVSIMKELFLAFKENDRKEAHGPQHSPKSPSILLVLD